MRCEKCGYSLNFVSKEYREGKATYECDRCGIRYEFERVRDSRILGEKWEAVSAKRIAKREEGKGG
jgi:hypothetical protein